MASLTEKNAEEGAKRYVVAAPKLPIVLGQNPRTGIDRVGEARKGQEVWLTDDELGRKLEKGYVFDPDETTAEEHEAEQAEAEETERLTQKQALQKEARELGLDDKGTIPELTSRIEEEKERRVADSDKTGESVNDSQLNSGS